MASEITIKLIFFALILLATAFEITGDVFFKKWTIGGKNILLIIGFIIYAIGTVFWAISLKYDYLSKAITVLSVINLIIVVLIGVLYFNESLSAINKIGIALGILGVILIEI